MNMVKKEEVKLVHSMNGSHIFLMWMTAVLVLLKDFLTGVLMALIVYALFHKMFDKPHDAESGSTASDANSAKDSTEAARA